MRNTANIGFLISIVFAFFSCSEKEPGPCDCDGQPTGQKCREIHYDADDYIGHTDFVYTPGGLISEKEWISTKGLDKKTNFEYKETGDISKEYVSYSDGSTAYWEYVYNEKGQLGIKRYMIDGVKKRVISYYYWENGLLKDRVFHEDGEQVERKRYTYDSNDEVWRIEEFDENNSLQEQRIYQYFSNNTQRIDIYDGAEEYMGYTFINETAEGIPLEIKAYNAEGNLIEYTLNDVRSHRLNRSAQYDGNGNLQGRTLFLYY